MNTWDKVRAALAAGEDPAVMLSHDMLATRVQAPESKRRGPAPKERIRFSLYSKVPGAQRKTDYHRCWNPYCRKRIHGRFVCNDDCRKLALEHLHTAINLLQGERILQHVEDVPDVAQYNDEGRLVALPGATPKRKVRDPRGRKPKGYRKTESPAAERTGEKLRKVIGEAFGGRKESG